MLTKCESLKYIWRWYLKSKFMLKATFIACRCECDQNYLYRKKLHAYLLFVLTKSKNIYDIFCQFCLTFPINFYRPDFIL